MAVDREAHDDDDADFEPLLRRALTGRDGAVAADALSLGEQMLAEGAGLRDVLAAHEQALLHVARTEAPQAATLVTLAMAVLDRALTPFDAQLRGVREQRHAQRDLRAMMRHQAEALDATNRALDEAAAQADRATRERSMFLANMSHEIRTPLNAVVGLAGLLQGATGEERAEHVATIGASADHLLFLINDILDFSKIEAGGIELEQLPFDLVRCVELALDLVAPEAAAKELPLAYELAPGTPTTLLGDEGRLRQVLVNLLSNAVKFSHEGEVLVSLEPLAGVVEGARVTVRDNGIGIAPDRIAQLFEPFTQADASTTRRYGGTGLGLAISRRLVELMGGALTVDSAPGEGATFTFDIPLAAAPDAAAAPRFDVDVLAGKRLLVLVPGETDRRILTAAGERAGMSVRATGDVEEALAWAESDGFELVVVDHGLGAPAAIAARLRDAGAPRVLLASSVAQSASTLGSARDLFAGLLAKPLKQSVLTDNLAAALGAAARDVAVETVDDTGARPARELRILIAEDHPVNQKVVRRQLQRLGHAFVDLVSDGAEALDAVLRERYDIVLMDVQMPRMDGIEATRLIKEHFGEDPARPRIVALTAEAMPGDQERLRAAGMDDYLAKPVTREVLAEALARVQ